MFTMLLAFVSFLILFKLFSTFGKQTMNKTPVKNNKTQLKRAAIVKNLEPSNSKISEKEIAILQNKFTDFTVESFINKSEEMFDAIFSAFANSHHHILKSMLNSELYEQFAENIKKREDKNLRQEILIKHKKTTIEKLELFQDKVKIWLDFSVSQMSAIINSEGVSFDNPKRIYRNILHKWKLERKFDDTIWTLSTTSCSEI